MPNVKLIHNPSYNLKGITHTIVLDDGEELSNEYDLLKNNIIPLRLIEIAITRVINFKKEPDYKPVKCTPTYEYIG